ncbi:MAG: DUF488 domain-containing protein [Desulfobulbaceae bacterium]
MTIEAKRVYSPTQKEDGVRVLVDRIWPRGMTKEQLRVDLWLKEAAPSTELRKWFGHDPARWKAFKNRYFAELDDRQQAVEQLLALAAGERLTLLYSARDMHHNQAVALKEYLEAKSDEKTNSR